MKHERKNQLELLKKQPLAYGGELLKTRKGRECGRTIDTKHTMHMVFKSSLAVGKWSFNRPENKIKIKKVFHKFSQRYGVKIFSIAYVGNHLHCQLKLSNRYTYRPFIRALTAAIAMAISGASRWSNSLKDKKFWDYRPYSRVVRGLQNFLNLRDYITINQYEGFGFQRDAARFIVSWHRSTINSS